MELNGLEVLRLDGNRVADVQALAPMTRLANLGLAGNPIADLWPLVGLGQLHRLDLSGSAVVDVSALGRLENLRWVWLGPETAERMDAWAPPAGLGSITFGGATTRRRACPRGRRRTARAHVITRPGTGDREGPRRAPARQTYRMGQVVRYAGSGAATAYER